MTRLIDPSALAAILLLAIVWWTEVAVFIEVLFGIVLVLAHVNLKFAGRAATLPAMIGIRIP